MRLPLVALLVAPLFVSCSYVPPGSINQQSELSKARSAYVVRDDPASEVGAYLESSLAAKGLKVYSGKAEARHKDTDIYVTYVDRWDWDLTMYLKSLDISVKSTKTDQLLASGNFHQGFFHTFPDTRGKTKEVVDSIFLNSPQEKASH